MVDIFDNKILCNGCDAEMKRKNIIEGGFLLRAVVCENCKDRIIHPVDLQEYKKFKDLKNKEYKVKMRLVGNSYTVSIPKEIVLFMKEQEKIFDEMVRLCFEDIGRLSINFNSKIRGDK